MAYTELVVVSYADMTCENIHIRQSKWARSEVTKFDGDRSLFQIVRIKADCE